MSVAQKRAIRRIRQCAEDTEREANDPMWRLSLRRSFAEEARLLKAAAQWLEDNHDV